MHTTNIFVGCLSSHAKCRDYKNYLCPWPSRIGVLQFIYVLRYFLDYIYMCCYITHLASIVIANSCHFSARNKP